MATASASPPANNTRDACFPGQKRPAAALDDNASDRANNKRRASRACLSCRNRKVRCDVTKSDVPCTNCRLDGVGCVVTESNRGRRPNAAGSSSADAAASTTITVSAPGPPAHPVSVSPRSRSSSRHQPSPRLPVSDEPGPEPPTAAVLSPATTAADYMLSLSFEGRSQDQPEQPVDHDRPRDQPDLHQQVQPLLGLDTPSQSSSLDPANSAPAGDHSFRWPAFIRPLPSHITAADMDYLAGKDALTIPDQPFRDELLRVYAEIVHPFMPALDLHELLACVLEARPNTVSMVLFQAIMFASVVFVDIGFLRSRGFGSRKAARKVFFNRVRLLYGLECERDQQVLVQTLLMMTYWYDSPEDEKDTWYWMGIAISHALVLGLHRDPQQLRISTEQKRLRRRIWWSCLIRDRLLALGIRRPSRIREDDFDVPTLALEDFDLTQASESVIGLLGESRLTLPNPAAREAMAVMCVDLAKLCVCLGHILHSQYSILGAQPITSSEYFFRVTVLPRRSEKQARDLIQYDAKLSEWLRNQDSRSKYTPGSRQNPDKADRIVRLHQAQLHMNYLTTLGVLHRPQVFSSVPGPECGRTRRLSREKVTEAANAMTRLAFDLESSDQLRYLPTSSIAAFLSATLIHLVEIRSPEEQVRLLGIGRFYQCVHALNQLQDMYSSADYAVRFLEMILRKIDINVPALKLGCLSMPRGGSHDRCATSYPTPSDSRNPHSMADNVPGAQCPIQADLAQSLDPMATPFEQWLTTADSTFWNNYSGGSADMAATPSIPICANGDLLLPDLMDVNGNFGF